MCLDGNTLVHRYVLGLDAHSPLFIIDVSSQMKWLVLSCAAYFSASSTNCSTSCSVILWKSFLASERVASLGWPLFTA